MRERYRKWRSTVWAFRKHGQHPNGYVCINEDGRVLVWIDSTEHLYQPYGTGSFEFVLDRRTARLLADRIVRALDETGR